MKSKIEFEYCGHWAEVTVRETQGLFLGGARITGQSPDEADRFWTGLGVEEQRAFLDPESCQEDWVRRAKEYIDRLMYSGSESAQ